MSGRLIAERYRLVAVLGRGESGTVWWARDDLLDRDVAIKELSVPVGVGPAERDAWTRRTISEVRLAIGLEHRSIAAVYDVIEDAGLPWVATELVRGRSLARLLADDGALPAHRVAEIGRQVLAGLIAAHAAEVIHGAVKPSNVLLCPDGRVALTDFCVAGVGEVKTWTRSRDALGYVAPERLRTRGGGGPESDLWSLGATLRTAAGADQPASARAGPAEHEPAETGLGPLAGVIEGLLRPDPADRMTSSLALALLERLAADDPGTVDQSQPAGRHRSGPAQRPAAWRSLGLHLPATPAASDTDPVSTPSTPSAPPGTAASAAAPPPGTGAAAAKPNRPHGWVAAAAVTVAVLLVAGFAVLGFGGGPDRRDASAGSVPVPPTVAALTPGPSGPPTPTGPPTGPLSSPTAAATATATVLPPAPGPDSSAPAPAPTGPPAPSTAVPAPLPTIPIGYFRFTHSSGFSIGVPNGWTVDPDAGGVWIREPGSGNHRELRVTVSAGGGDPLGIAGAREQAAVEADTYPQYIRLELAAAVAVLPAADWEYTWFASSFGYAHVTERVVVTAGRRYLIRWQTPDWQWGESTGHLGVFLATFNPIA